MKIYIWKSNWLNVSYCFKSNPKRYTIFHSFRRSLFLFKYYMNTTHIKNSLFFFVFSPPSAHRLPVTHSAPPYPPPPPHPSFFFFLLYFAVPTHPFYVILIIVFAATTILKQPLQLIRFYLCKVNLRHMTGKVWN